MSRSTNLVIKLASGVEAPERLAQAFTVATTALASGITVSFWLTGEASWLALPGRAQEFHLEHAPSIADSIATILATGTLTLCTQCAVRRDIKEGDLIAEIRIAGAAAYVEEITADGTQALIY
jgi:predicted peroxiredoxin